jgi:RimJ/RimL family protein N-acetyltransferase
VEAPEASESIPYRIEIEDGPVLRCWEPRDAELLKDAVDSSLEHLRPWMPWAQAEPQTVEEKAALLRQFRGWFDLRQDFVYGVFSPDESEVLGGTGLHPRVGDGAFEIGYWVRQSRVGRGIATTTAAALAKVGIELGGADRIEIRVDPANETSCRIPRRLGFVEEAVLRRRLPVAPGAPRRDAVVFSLFAEDLAASPAARVRLRAFDCLGRQVVAAGTRGATGETG